MFVDRRKHSRTKLLIGPDIVSHETQTQAPPPSPEPNPPPIPEPDTLGELFVTMLIDL